MPKAQFTGNIDGDRIVDGSIKGEDLAPDLALSTTGTINANKKTVSTTADVSGGTLTTSTAQKTAIVNKKFIRNNKPFSLFLIQFIPNK